MNAITPMNSRRVPWWLIGISLVLTGMAGCWVAGLVLLHRHRVSIGRPPVDLPAHNVVFPSASGATIHGWFVPGSRQGAVLLLHGVRANRLSMLDRARFLHEAGYAVMLIDFQASGESSGSAITFGYRESENAVAAVAQLRSLAPGQKIGVIGTSMGGAAALLADPPLHVDAMVLEQVYPTLAIAMQDRLELYLGVFGRWLAPIVATTFKPHLGIAMDQLRPIDRIAHIRVPNC